MPDGTTRGRIRTTVVLCEVGKPICPSCDRTVRITVGDGWAVTTCDARTKKLACGQKILIVGIRGAICLVIGLTLEDFEKLRIANEGSQLVLRRLGLMGVPLMAAS